VCLESFSHYASKGELVGKGILFSSFQMKRQRPIIMA
jgi:hypothetical protein